MSEEKPFLMRFWDHRGIIMDRSKAEVAGDDTYVAVAPQLMRIEYVDILQTIPSTRSLGKVKMPGGGELIDKGRKVMVKLNGLGGGVMAR